MSVTLAEIFDEQFKNVKFDSKLARNIYLYQIGYINRNREHLEFFGSNLLGVHVVRFKDSDVLKLYEEVLDIDYLTLSDDLKKVSAVNQDYKVSSDVLNLTCMYLIHKFLTSSLLVDSARKRAAYDCALIFFYRCTAALLSYYFKYPSDPKVAQAAFAKLSNKYLIKKLGSWHKVMDYRANDLIDKDSIHYKKLLSFNDDLATIYAINDAQGRIRDLIKNYYAEFIKVHSEGAGIATTSSTFLDAEGEETIKEKTKSVESYISYIRNIIIDKHSFVNDELISVINQINKNTSFRMIKTNLNWMVDNYNSDSHMTIDDFVTNVIIYSFYLLNNNESITNLRDYPRILTELKNLYLSTRSTDPDLIKIRDLGSDIIKKCNVGKLSESLILSTRTSLILYITLRALVGKNK
jgi:hypothetical protein